MRFFTFNYMTYKGLDAVKAIEDYGVGWCTLPNSECDPTEYGLGLSGLHRSGRSGR